ncbi:MAG: DUF3179 domain-containing protein, partial [Saprospiraceae bacterium]|nr:DUF3179 domain-containing protein [Saprospiraceae bacterium]
MIQQSNILCILFLSMGLIMSCSDDNADALPSGSSGGNSSSDWILNQGEVFDGGPGKDGIPSVDNPNFLTTDQIDFNRTGDLMLAIKNETEIKGYPHVILDWHEIVNDRVGNQSIAITYCPLTGTGIAWDRNVGGTETSFGVSGLLYRNNLIPYDRATDSNWSQIRLDCVQGELVTTRATTFSMIEMPWSTWELMFPDEKVMSKETGFSRNYGVYPYGDYRANNNRLLFPVGQEDSRLPKKERVLGIIIGNSVKVYRFHAFEDGLAIIDDVHEDRELVVIGSKEHNFMMA